MPQGSSRLWMLPPEPHHTQQRQHLRVSVPPAGPHARAARGLLQHHLGYKSRAWSVGKTHKSLPLPPHYWKSNVHITSQAPSHATPCKPPRESAFSLFEALYRCTTCAQPPHESNSSAKLLSHRGLLCFICYCYS